MIGIHDFKVYLFVDFNVVNGSEFRKKVWIFEDN